MSDAHEELHRLVDALPERQAILAKRLLEAILLDLEDESESLTSAEREALQRARDQAAAGETVDWQVLKGELERGV